MAHTVALTYRAKLLHLEMDGEPVLDDDGSPLVELLEFEVPVSLRTLQAQTPRSVALLRLAAQRAVKVANAGMEIDRPMQVLGVAFLRHRTIRPRRSVPSRS